MASGFTALGKKKMFEHMLEPTRQLLYRVYASDTIGLQDMLDTVVASSAFRNNWEYDDPRGTVSNDMTMNFTISESEDVKYIVFFIGDYGTPLWLHELIEAIDFPTGGTYSINKQVFELNMGGNHVKLSPFED